VKERTGERRSGKAIVKEMVGTTPALGVVVTAKNGVDLVVLWSSIRYLLLLVVVFVWCSWFFSSLGHCRALLSTAFSSTGWCILIRFIVGVVYSGAFVAAK
jgi:hypothetical protein